VEPAVAIASQVRTGRLRATDVVASALEAARVSHDDLNAFTLIDVDGAMRRAEAIDELVASGRDPGPLAGVPIAIKDIIDDTGLPNRLGSSFPAAPARASATVVRNLGAAGAVIIGRTGLHEFAFGFTSENPWFGPVRNPWDTDTSPGGSSGGSGAAVAAGIVPIGIGTDTGGSVRVPAAMCGVLGLKVTHGRVSLDGVFPLVPSLDTVGPLARTVADLEVAYRAMAGDDPADPWSQPHSIEAAHRPGGAFRLGIVSQWLEPPMSADVRSGFNTFVTACTDLGMDVREISVGELAPVPAVTAAIGPEIIAVHGERYRNHPDRYGADVASRIEASAAATTDDVLTAERWGSAARAAISRLAEAGFDALIAPTVGAMTKVIGDDDVDIDGRKVFHREALARFTAPINRIRVPALSLPVAGTAGQGVSVQLVGPMWSESGLLGIASTLESERVLEVRRPPIFLG
jgi:Asp-tRNA(Asn)/Glu-tRNA(Gln) amidotransferase A subunit family amidase